MIRFLSPVWLFAVLPVLGVAGAYWWRQRRRSAFAVRFSNVELLRSVAPGGIGPYRRHSAAVALLLSLFILALGLARPRGAPRRGAPDALPCSAAPPRRWCC